MPSLHKTCSLSIRQPTLTYLKLTSFQQFQEEVATTLMLLLTDVDALYHILPVLSGWMVSLYSNKQARVIVENIKQLI